MTFTIQGDKFEPRVPSPQTAVDLFAGHWACNLGAVLPGVKSDGIDAFATDGRPHQAARAFGRDGRMDGMTVLELGPLDGAHSYLLAGLGARVVAIESNKEAFLKCLIVKELLELARCQFLLGDFVEYLRAVPRRFDLVFCSGVLYHMQDPLELIRLICAAVDRCFVWTHHYVPATTGSWPALAAECGGFKATYHHHHYPDPAAATFWGGHKPVASWMERNAILEAFRHFGMTEQHVLDSNDAGMPWITFAAQRPGGS